MNPDFTNERKKAVYQLIAGAKAIVDIEGVTRSGLANIPSKLNELAAQPQYWGADSYPASREKGHSVLYNIAEDSTRGFALYLDVACPGKKVLPHNYMTWHALRP